MPTKPQYIINPYTGRNIKVGSRIYNELVRLRVIKPTNTTTKQPILNILNEKQESDNETDIDIDIESESSSDLPDMSEDEKNMILKLASKLNRKK